MIFEKHAFFRKIPIILVLFAVFLCGIPSGGMRWQHCIVPCFCLCAAAFFNKIKSTGMITDDLVLVSVICCAFSVIFTKGDMQEAIHESLKYCCFIAAIFAGISSGRENVLKIIAAFGVFTAFAGILAYCNIVRAAEFVFNDRGILRLQSFIKYANTTAVFLGCAYFALCGIRFKYGKAAGFLKMLVLSAMYLTVSKAAIPIFLVIGTGYMLKKRDADFAVHNIVCIIFILPAVFLAGKYMFAQCLLLIILWIAAGTLLGGRLRFTAKLSAAWLSAAAFACIAAVFLAVTGNFDLLSTFTYRLKYMADSLPLLFDGVFGTGPASWQLLQYQVQQEQYNVMYIHNGWLQFLVENGILFFASFVGIAVISVYRMIKEQAWDLLAVFAFIAIHSFIDINFGFAAILAVFGLVCGSCQKPAKKGFPVALLISALVACYGTAEYFVRADFESKYIKQDYDSALKSAYMLEKICPGDSSLQMSIASLSGRDIEMRIQKAMVLSPYNRNILESYARLKIETGDRSVMEVLDKYISLAPKQEATYTTVKQLAMQAYTYGIITEGEFGEFTGKIDSLMKDEGVIDPGTLLDDIKRKDRDK